MSDIYDGENPAEWTDEDVKKKLFWTKKEVDEMWFNQKITMVVQIITMVTVLFMAWKIIIE